MTSMRISSFSSTPSGIIMPALLEELISKLICSDSRLLIISSKKRELKPISISLQRTDSSSVPKLRLKSLNLRMKFAAQSQQF